MSSSSASGVIPKGRKRKPTGWWNRGKIGEDATTPDTAVVELVFMIDSAEPNEVFEALTNGMAMTTWSKQNADIMPTVGEIYTYMNGLCSVENRTLAIGDDEDYFIKQKWRMVSM